MPKQRSTAEIEAETPFIRTVTAACKDHNGKPITLSLQNHLLSVEGRALVEHLPSLTGGKDSVRVRGKITNLQKLREKDEFAEFPFLDQDWLSRPAILYWKPRRKKEWETPEYYVNAMGQELAAMGEPIWD